MKILIPLSGGFDSTYLLWQALTKTEHDIYVLHVRLNNSSARYVPEQQACDNIQLWFANNCRGINEWSDGSIEMLWSMGGINDYVALAPLIVSQVMSYGGVDEIWMGSNIEEYEVATEANFNDGDHWFRRYIGDVWHWGCGGCPSGQPFQGLPVPRLVHPTMHQRKADMMAEIPPDLMNLSWSCHSPDVEVFPGETDKHYTPCGNCTSCLLRKGLSSSEAFDYFVDALYDDKSLASLRA